MANDFELKQVRRLIQGEIDKGEMWKQLGALVGDNIKEAVLDSEIQVKKQELAVIKQDITKASERWEAERKKREADTNTEVSRFDQSIATKRKEYEAGLTDLKTKTEDKEVLLKTAIRNTEQRISQAQKKADEGVQEIFGEAESKKKELKQELVGLAELRDSMKEEIRAMQNKYLRVRV